MGTKTRAWACFSERRPDDTAVNPLGLRFLGTEKYTGTGIISRKSTPNKKNNISLPPRCTTNTTIAACY
jgi:hypothetical protein